MALIPIILSGGSGTRLWPLSRKSYPKQLMPLVGELTLLQETAQRLPEKDVTPPIVVCNQDHRFMIAQQLDEIGRKGPIVLEPTGKNTAPATTAGCLLALKQEKNPLVLVMPSDHIIRDIPAFHAALEIAVEVSKNGALVTFGIKPDHAATGYGYIEQGCALEKTKGAFEVTSFVEKPDEKTAIKYLESKKFFWNSGIFLFSAKRFLEELEKFEPQIFENVSVAVKNSEQDLDFIRLEKTAFEKSPANSIDYAVMEKTDAAAVVPVSMGWSDIGSWTSLLDLGKRDKRDNVILGEAVTLDTKRCYIRSEKGIVGTLGVEDLIIVNLEDALLVADKNRSQDVKKIVAKLSEQQRSEINVHAIVHRPWGTYQTIDFGPRFKVKNIEVKPGASLSLQMHHHRAEHWVVVRGTAKVTRDDETMLLEENQSTYIPIGVKHRLENPGKFPLNIIEVQSGAYLEEDDIVRFDDVYGRDKEKF